MVVVASGECWLRASGPSQIPGPIFPSTECTVLFVEPQMGQGKQDLTERRSHPPSAPRFRGAMR